MHQVQTNRVAARPPSSPAPGSSLAAAVGVAALADGPRWLVGVLVTVALLSDLVDGRVARATGTASELGARFDMEADALLILVLSAIVATDLGWWVLGIGLARYVFGAVFTAGRPAAAPPARPRFWCKVVAVLVGIVLAVAAVLPLPDLVATVAVAVVAVLLAESFLHEAVDRWRAPGAPLVVPYGTGAGVPRGLAGAGRADRPRPPDRDGAAPAPARGAGRGRPGPGAVAAAAGRRCAARVRPAAGACSCWSRCSTCRSTRSSTGLRPGRRLGLPRPGVGVLGDSIGDRLGAGGRGAGRPGHAGGAGRRTARDAAPGQGRRGPPPVLADRGHGVRVRVGALLRDRRPGGAGRAGRLDQRGGADRRRGAAGARPTSRTSASSPSEIDDRPVRRAGRGGPEALLTGLRGKDVLVVFVESYGRVAVAGHVVLRGDHAGPRPGHPAAARRPATTRAARSSPRRRSARAAGWRTPPCSPGCGSTASGATGSCSARTG